MIITGLRQVKCLPKRSAMVPQMLESVLEQSMIAPFRHHSAFIRQAGSVASKNEIDESSQMEVVNLALCRLQFCTGFAGNNRKL